MNVGKAVEAGTKRKGSSSFPAMAEESKENRRSGIMGGTKRPKVTEHTHTNTQVYKDMYREERGREVLL